MKTEIKNKTHYFLIDLEDKCLVLKIDFSVSWSKACEVIAMFSSEKKVIAEKFIEALK